MWIGLAIIGYLVGVVLLIRFFQTVHRWDEEIEKMENEGCAKKIKKPFRPAA